MANIQYGPMQGYGNPDVFVVNVAPMGTLTSFLYEQFNASMSDDSPTYNFYSRARHTLAKERPLSLHVHGPFCRH